MFDFLQSVFSDFQKMVSRARPENQNKKGRAGKNKRLLAAYYSSNRASGRGFDKLVVAHAVLVCQRLDAHLKARNLSVRKVHITGNSDLPLGNYKTLTSTAGRILSLDNIDIFRCNIGSVLNYNKTGLLLNLISAKNGLQNVHIESGKKSTG
nr:MAG TPA: hypothetical protein [Caudoviricetes sp.]